MAEPLPCPDDDHLVALALGDMTGRPRAATLGHLVGCPRCRATVDAVMGTTEHLLLAAPDAEPPLGFESDVLTAMGGSTVDARRPVPRTLLAVAAALLVALGLVAGVALRADGARPEVTEAAMATPGGRDVGRVWSYQGDTPWLFISIPAWNAWDSDDGSPDYTLRAQLDDGTTLDLGQITFAGAKGAWGTTTPVDTRQIRSVAITDTIGRTWCQADL